MEKEELWQEIARHAGETFFYEERAAVFLRGPGRRDVCGPEGEDDYQERL